MYSSRFETPAPIITFPGSRLGHLCSVGVAGSHLHARGEHQSRPDADLADSIDYLDLVFDSSLQAGLPWGHR